MATKASAKNEDLQGLPAVRATVAKLLGVKETDLPQDDGIYWYDSLKQWGGDNGYTVQSHPAAEVVQGQHIGLYHSEGQLYAATLDGNEIVENPSGLDTAAATLTQRLTFEKSGAAKQAKEDK